MPVPSWLRSPSRVALREQLRISVPVLGAFVVGAIAYGGLYCFPPISVSFAGEFQVSRTLAVTPWTIFLLVSGLSSPLLGRAFDVFFDRQLLTAGMLLMAVGWVVAAIAPDVSVLVVAYGIFLAIGLQLVFVGTTTAIARRYAGRAGLALGVAYSGPGIGVAVTLPIVASVIGGVGWREIMVGFAVSALGGVPFVWLMTSGPSIVVPIRQPRMRPKASSKQSGLGGARVGLDERPGRGLHETSAPGAIAAAQEPAPPGSQPRVAGLRRTLRTRRFWILFAGAVALGAIDEGVFQVFIPHAISRGIDSGLAARALSLESLSYVFGQVAGGALSDRSGRRFVGVVMAILVGLGATAAFAADASMPSLAVAGMAIHGFGIGASIAIRSAAFSDVFGGRNFGSIFGVLAIAYPMGGIVAMYTGALAFDRLGTYWPVYVLIVGSLATWAGALLAAGPRRHGLAARLAGVRERVAR